MKKFIITIILMLIGIAPVFAIDSLPAAKGKVLAVQYVDTENITGGETNQTKQLATIKILTGAFKGDEVTIENHLTTNPAYDILLTKGDRVILHLEQNGEFMASIDDINCYIADIERTNIIYLFCAIFFTLLILIGKKKGLYCFLSIFITVILIFFILTPMVLNGINPILATLLISIISTIITIYLVAGLNYKSTSAIIGTILSLVFASLLSLLAIKTAALTGFGGEETMFLYTTRPDLDFTGLLSASMILAALGAVMDVGVSIASTINEIYSKNNSLNTKELFESGMNVGKDIIGTMSNTLILVYLGSSLPLLLLSSNIDFVKFFNLNHVATEILSAIIGSTALLICVPVSAIISAYLIKKYDKE